VRGNRRGKGAGQKEEWFVVHDPVVELLVLHEITARQGNGDQIGAILFLTDVTQDLRNG
jgi:hypothetical protein